MRRSRWFGLVLAAVVAWPLLAQEEKPGPKETKPQPKEKEKYVRAGKIAGKVVAGPDKDNVLTFSVPLGRNWENLKLRGTDDLKVRWLRPPEVFDDKGRLKKPTRKELDEMKGPDKTLPGYTADLTDLKPGQTVEIHLVKKAGRPKDPKDKDLVAEYAERVSIVVIAAEP
jgi:hypothetical protein